MASEEEDFQSADEGEKDPGNGDVLKKSQPAAETSPGATSASSGATPKKGKKMRRKKGKNSPREEKGQERSKGAVVPEEQIDLSDKKTSPTSDKQEKEQGKSSQEEKDQLAQGALEAEIVLEENIDLSDDKISQTADDKEKLLSTDTNTESIGEPKVQDMSSENRVHENPSSDKKQVEARTALDRLTADDDNTSTSGGGWGWVGGFGSSILNTASSSVVSFSSSLGEGIMTAVETVEAGLGVPDPEMLAKIESERRKEKEEESKARARKLLDEDQSPDKDLTKESNDTISTQPSKELASEQEASEQKASEQEASEQEEKTQKQDSSSSWFSGWGVDHLSAVVNKTAQVVGKVQESSSTLVHGSLGALETLGKKTYHAVAEGEHGVKKQLKGGEKCNLSLMLREAAEEAENKAKQEEQFVEARKSHFGAQFDDNQGLVQLEALEMLSNQCEGQLHALLSSLPSETLSQTKGLLVAIKEAFTVDDMEDNEEDDQDFEGLLTESTGELGLSITADKLISARSAAMKVMNAEEDQSAAVIHQDAIQALAKLTAFTVGHFHRIGQLCLADSTSQATIYKTRASSLVASTKVICVEVGLLAARFTDYLSSSASDKEETKVVNPLMTNIYLEATNSSSYIQDAFQLLLPVMQQAALHALKKEGSPPPETE